MAMRLSSYFNHVDIGDGTSLLYHGANLSIDLARADYVTRWIEDEDFSFLSADEIRHLLDRGHLTDDSLDDELSSFRSQVASLVGRYRTPTGRGKGGTLYLVLDYACNLSCSYCFQNSLDRKAMPSRMSAEIADAVLSKHLGRLFPDTPAERIRIILFGGEPLLPANRDTVLRVLDFARRHKMVVSAATNGTTLDTMGDLIGPERIGNVQITLDGDADFHDLHRVPRSGKPTFETMFAAIHALIERQANVFIRVHVHPANLASVTRLIDRLDESGILGQKQVELYFKQINGFGEDETNPEFVDAFRRLFQRVAARTGFPPANNLDVLKLFLVMTSREEMAQPLRYCGLGAKTRVVDGRGDIYNCSEEQGMPDRRVGAIIDGDVRYFPLLESYGDRHILNIPECLNCSAAMFCRGGCARQALVRTGTILAPDCHHNREMIGQTLKAYFLGARDGHRLIMA